MLACAVVLLGTAQLVRYLQRSGVIKSRAKEPQIPLYPQAWEVRRQVDELIGWKSVTFRAPEDYPSLHVLDFYRKTLEKQGYRSADGKTIPSWSPEAGKSNARRLVLSAHWRDPAGLRLFALEIAATEKIVRDPQTGRLIARELLPGLQVTCTLSRKVFIPED